MGLIDPRPIRRSSFCYDAVAILGLGKASSEPLPAPAPGEVVIRVGAWSIKDLLTRETVGRKNLMWDDMWYDQYDWSNVKLTPGVYRVRMPIADSNSKNFSEQRKLLLSGEEVAPVAAAATALLCHLKEAGKDLLEYDCTRCAEALPGEDRVGLRVLGGRVDVDLSWDDDRDGGLWLAGCRKS